MLVDDIAEQLLDALILHFLNGPGGQRLETFQHWLEGLELTGRGLDAIPARRSYYQRILQRHGLRPDDVDRSRVVDLVLKWARQIDEREWAGILRQSA